MKKNVLTLIVALSAVFTTNAQDVPKSNQIGWFITPEVGLMFLEDHVGNSVGASFGMKLWKNRLKIGINAYGRSGPINPKTFTVEAYNGQSYKGSSTLTLRADYGTIGLMIAPTFKVKNVEIDVPVSYGMGGGGFYLVGDDRNTPDGARVSEWENKLMNGEDAASGSWMEFGIRGFFPSKINGIQVGAGVHYSIVQGWKTYYDPSGEFYNNKLRASLFVNFGSY
ncbi:MAG: hypothetical protein ACK5SQ_05520 [Chitinophagales bacterium]